MTPCSDIPQHRAISHAREITTLKKILVLFAAILPAHAFGSKPSIAPLIEPPVQASCKEHILAEPKITLSDWPDRARGRELSAYVVISYDLDGSGRASNAKVTDSVPKGLFDRATLSILRRTDFAPGVEVNGCTYVRTYDSMRRTGRR